MKFPKEKRKNEEKWLNALACFVVWAMGVICGLVWAYIQKGGVQ